MPCEPPLKPTVTSRPCRFGATLILLVAGAALAAPAGEPIGGDFTLTDHRGQPYALNQARGLVVILAFGYRFCPDVCPTTLATLAAVMRQLGDQAERVQPLFVSLDPDRDTPETLGPFVGYFHPRLIGLTGDAQTLARVAGQYRVRYAFVGKGEREHYSLDHTASVYVLDPGGHLVRIVPYGLPAEEIAETVRGLLAAGGSAK